MNPTALIKRLAVAGAVGIAVFISISRSDNAPSYSHEGGLGSADSAMAKQGIVLDRLSIKPIGVAPGTNKYSASAQPTLDVGAPRLDSANLRAAVALPRVQPISTAGGGAAR